MIDLRSYTHMSCDCVPTLGPPHCHLCDAEWPCVPHQRDAETVAFVGRIINP